MLKRITCGVLMKKLFLYILLPAVVCTFSACSIEKMEEEKKRDLAYTVIEQDEMPQELKEQIEKEEKMSLASPMQIKASCMRQGDSARRKPTAITWRLQHAMKQKIRFM